MNDVQVLNQNPFPLKGRFAATDYLFAPDRPTAVPLAAAEHIFGMNDKDKTGALNRLGLLLPGNGSTYESAMAVLRRVSFHSGRVVFEQGQPGKPKPPQPPPQQQPEPKEPARGPGEHESGEDDEETGKGIGARPGAAVRVPGRKSEVAENPTPSAASGDLDSYLATLINPTEIPDTRPQALRRRPRKQGP